LRKQRPSRIIEIVAFLVAFHKDRPSGVECERNEVMALPSLSDEQRKEYLEKAAAMRKARAQVRKDLKTGKLSFSELIDRADDPVIARLKVVTLLESLPGYGKARALALLEEVGIAETRKVQGLGSRQREELLAILK